MYAGVQGIRGDVTLKTPSIVYDAGRGLRQRTHTGKGPGIPDMAGARLEGGRHTLISIEGACKGLRRIDLINGL